MFKVSLVLQQLQKCEYDFITYTFIIRMVRNRYKCGRNSCKGLKTHRSVEEDLSIINVHIDASIE